MLACNVVLSYPDRPAAPLLRCRSLSPLFCLWSRIGPGVNPLKFWTVFFGEARFLFASQIQAHVVVGQFLISAGHFSQYLPRRCSFFDNKGPRVGRGKKSHFPRWRQNNGSVPCPETPKKDARKNGLPTQQGHLDAKMFFLRSCLNVRP